MRKRFISRTGKQTLRRVRLQLEELESRELPSSTLPNLSIDPNSFAANDIIVRWQSGGPTQNALTTGAVPLGNNTYDILLAKGVTALQAVSYYSALAGVNFAQPDYLVTSASVSAPTDPYLSSQWYLSTIHAQTAWNVTTGGSRILVAEIDTGVSADTDLVPNLVAGYNFITNTANAADDNGHGTIVAGEIGAVGNNGVGVAGVDWNVEIMPLKFLDANGNGYLSNAVLAINYAVASGAKIINASWGGGSYDAATASAIQNAQSHGVIFVAAAGNNGSNDDITPEYPANYAYNNVISVAATDQNNNIASFSDYGGHSVSLAAPGAYILSTAPGNTYEYYSGTSMAAPLVTGALALVWSIHPTWTYTQVINDLLNNTDKLASLNGKVETGLLDVGKAVAAAMPTTAAPTAAAPATTSKTTTATTTQTATTTTFSSGNVNLAVPTQQSATSTMTVSQHETITTLTVTVNVKAAADAGVEITLVSPTGQSILLFNRRGGAGQNLTNTTFADASPNAIYLTAAPFTGTIRPEYALAGFKNINVYGTWKLIVTDTLKSNPMTLVNWSLNVTGTAGTASTAGMLVGEAAPVVAWVFSRSGAAAVQSVNSQSLTARQNTAGGPQSPAYAPAQGKTILFAANEPDSSDVVTDTEEVDRLLAAIFINPNDE
jgi:subtilisin family serine protease